MAVHSSVFGKYTFEYEDKEWGEKQVHVRQDLLKVGVKWKNGFVVSIDSGKVTTHNVPPTGYILIKETASGKQLFKHGTPPPQAKRSAKLVTA